MTDTRLRYPLRTATRTALLTASLSMLMACTAETGIVINVSQQGLETQPDTLRFFLGVQEQMLGIELPECGAVARYNDDTVIADRIVAVTDRDLASDPYKLLLRAGQALEIDRDIMVVVLALRGDDPVGVGTLDTPVNFVPEKLTSWSITVRPIATGDYKETQFGCHCASAAGGMVAITPVDDPDCDGDVGDRDCDDNNPSVGMSQTEDCATPVDDDCSGVINDELDEDQDGYFSCRNDCRDQIPTAYFGARERCDGINTDCNPETPRYPSEVDCYVWGSDDADECFIGKRECDDTGGWQIGGWKDSCKPVGDNPADQASPWLCSEFDACPSMTEDYQENAACAEQRVFDTYYCDQKVRVNTEQNRYELCPGIIRLDGEIPPTENCRWMLMGGIEQGDYSVGLHALFDGNLDPASTVEACDPVLRILEINPQPPTELQYGDFKLWSELDGQPYRHNRIKVYPDFLQAGEPCPQFEPGIVCEGLFTDVLPAKAP